LINVHRLSVLRSVVDSGSVSGAAAELAYTPSAVSQHIAALERETGVKLLERVGRRVRPTAAGSLLALHADGILERVAEAETALRALAAGRAGRLRLTGFASASAGLLPQAISRFRRRHPDVELELTMEDQAPALAALRAGRVELAVVLLDLVQADDEPPGPLDGELEWRLLLRDPVYVALPRAHPLAQRRAITLHELLAAPLVSGDRSPDCPVAASFAACCARHGLTPSYAVEVDDFPTVQSLVAAGVGLAAIPQLGLAPAVHDGIAVRPLERPPLVRRIYAATRPGATENVLVAGMLEDLRAAAASVLRGR
jgi:DNA-binding transcriptional LysR family regulator